MNNVTISGKCWEPNVRTSQSGMICFDVSVSVYDGKDRDGKARYFSLTVKAFKDAAEAAGDTIQKGDNVLVTGRLTQETWDDKTTGKKQYKTVLMADTIAKDTRQFKKSNDPAGKFGQDVSDEDVPW